jgi:hypothetical protein
VIVPERRLDLLTFEWALGADRPGKDLVDREKAGFALSDLNIRG